ncbi:NUDIX hydrolase [Candidatus Woesearchaeota archaeon]|nr:NUDIX hydrolase [Candidatus Woesearchaeota archaeon]
MEIGQFMECVIFDNLTGCKVVSYKEELWRPTDQTISDLIGDQWRKMEARNISVGATLTNGLLVRANEMHMDEQRILEVAAQKLDYKSHATTRDNPDIPITQRGLGLYVTAQLVSSDSYLVFGRTKNTEIQYQDIINVIAGGVEPQDIVIGQGLEHAMLREVKEETGQEDQDIVSINISYVIREMIAAHPSLVHIISSRLNSREMIEVYKSHTHKQIQSGESPELKELHFIPIDKKKIVKALEDSANNYHERVRIVLLHTINQL